MPRTLPTGNSPVEIAYVGIGARQFFAAMGAAVAVYVVLRLCLRASLRASLVTSAVAAAVWHLLNSAGVAFVFFARADPTSVQESASAAWYLAALAVLLVIGSRYSFEIPWLPAAAISGLSVSGLYLAYFFFLSKHSPSSALR